MKSVLMVLVLMMSVAAEARVNWTLGNREYKNVRVENIGVNAVGTIRLKTALQDFEIPKAVVEQTGLKTIEFIELVEKYNKSTTDVITFNITLSPNLINVGRLTFNIDQ